MTLVFEFGNLASLALKDYTGYVHDDQLDGNLANRNFMVNHMTQASYVSLRHYKR